MKSKFTFYDAFAGIGSAYFAAKKANENTKLVGLFEWKLDSLLMNMLINKNTLEMNSLVSSAEPFVIPKIRFSKDGENAIKDNKIFTTPKYVGALQFWKNKYQYSTYFDLYNTNIIPGDIDIFYYSPPSTDITYQGLQQGLNPVKKNRSTTLWQIEHLISNVESKPKVLVMECVASITNKRNLPYLEEWLSNLSKLGYHSKYTVLNAKDFYVPQNRNSCFVVSFLNKDQLSKFKWPKKRKNHKPIHNIITPKYDIKSWNQKLLNIECNENTPISNYLLTDSDFVKAEIQNWTDFESEKAIFSSLGVGPTLTSKGAYSKIKIKYNNQLKVLNPYEAFLYQGFPKRIAKSILDTKLFSPTKIIELLGTASNINLLKNIFKNVMKSFK